MEEADENDWKTRDGRIIPLEEMFVTHIGAAKAKIGRWLKGEEDPEVRRDLKKWQKKFGKELRDRARAWKEQRNAGK